MLVGGELAGRGEDDRQAERSRPGPAVAEGERGRRDHRPHAAGQAQADRCRQAAAGLGALGGGHRGHYAFSVRPRPHVAAAASGVGVASTLPRVGTQLPELAGRPVGRIGFGAMQLPGRRVFGPPRDRSEALAVLRRAVELGVNHIDTAQFYGPDVANELIHAALHPYPEDLVLVSKVGAVRDAEGGWNPAQRPADLRRGVEDNLRSLAVDRVDVVNLRLHAEPGDEEIPLADQLGEMAALREEGKIGGIGLSNVTLEQLDAGLRLAEIACVQNSMSLLERGDQPALDRCREEGIAYVPFFPLGSAFPGARHVRDEPVVAAVAAKHGASAAQVGLAWLLQHSPNVLLIPGTSSVGHLEENVAAGELALDADDLRRLDALGRPGG
jgi:pyridoxine 4-dehydrogenase